MPSKQTWSEFAKEYAEKNGMTHEEAMQHPKVKLAYLNYAAVRVLK